MNEGFVYIMSNKNRTTLYIGVTNNLERRILEHKCGKGSKFTSKYLLFDLVYYEVNGDIEFAISREKQLKNWHRDWKWNLIKEDNPLLEDLAADWYTQEDFKEYKQFLKSKEYTFHDTDTETSSA